MYIIYFIFGLVTGSFLNVVIYRMPRDESIVFPPSHCPECEHELSVRELIPVLSYIIQRGRCRECGGRISIRYPLVEAGTGFLFVFNAHFIADFRAVIAGLFLSSALLAMAVIDINHQILPDKLTLTGLAAGFILAFLRPDIHPLSAISGVLAGGGFLLAIALASRGGLGGGDIKMMAFVGSFIGPALVMLAIFVGAFLGLIANIPGLISGDMRMKSKLPFGPFLAASSLIMWFFGDTLLAWYLNLVG